MKTRNIKSKHILYGWFIIVFIAIVLWDIEKQSDQALETINNDIREYSNAVQYVNANMKMEPPQIAITFDDGPSARFTPVLLEGLKVRGVRATFFLIGKNAELNSTIVKQMYEDGHLIGNHTYNHAEITKLSDEEALHELQSTSDLIEGITGQGTEYMRPPFGLWQKELETKLNIFQVMWSIDPLDWTTENVDEIVNKVVTEVGEGDIILLHDCYSSSVEAALRIIDILQKQGYEFVTVDELILK